MEYQFNIILKGTDISVLAEMLELMAKKLREGQLRDFDITQKDPETSLKATLSARGTFP